MKTNVRMSSFLLVLMVLGGLNLFSGCAIAGEKGDGNVTRQTRNVTGFTGIDVSGAFDIYLKQASEESVVVEADNNFQPVIKTELRGTTLKIYCDKPINRPTAMKVYISVKSLTDIELSGACDVFSEGKLSFPELSLETSGASDSELELEVGKLEIDCSGASKMKFRGTATTVNADLSGACNLYAFDLVSETVILSLSGAGSAEINVSKKIQADISGAGNVKYKGSPTEVDQRVSGAGSIKKVQ